MITQKQENYKMVKKFRWRKVTPEILKQIKKLRTNGLSYQEIAEEFKLNKSTIEYHVNPKSKKRTIERALKSYKKLSGQEKAEKNKKTATYRKKYYYERYQNDPEFRKRLIKNIIKYQRKKMKNKRKDEKHLFLRRPCKKCGNIFNPTSKFNYRCPPCLAESEQLRKR